MWGTQALLLPMFTAIDGPRESDQQPNGSGDIGYG